MRHLYKLCKPLVIFFSIQMLFGCSNTEADADMAICNKQYPTGIILDGDQANVINCMKEKGWKTNFMTGVSWWQSRKGARNSGTYSR